ncbi:phenoloxidase-activating factor 2-like [Drosophila bipectinata]|uniref:phenoloxidase-activating factor 2-like n=1 Tax=Drosophila bipectinata TaxID=42026 RepID=UPI001C899B48|nr:phenoloxidase-activating factor 2-like [Drosophila bipectinata]
MARVILVSMLCLFLALAVVQAVRRKSCGGSSKKSCTPRYLCNVGEVDKDSGNFVGTFRNSNDSLECSSTQICCSIENIQSDSTKKTVPAPTQCGHHNPKGLTFYTKSKDYAQEGEFPWVVALMSLDDYTYKGAGSLIADNLVLTSASKVRGEDENSLKVRAGEWDMKTTTEHYASVESRISRIIPHKDFDGRSPAYNIAILVLDRPFQPRPHIYPICLPSWGETFDLSNCITNGWGQKNFDDVSNVHVMKKVEVPVVPARICEQKISGALKKPFNLHKSLLCAGGEKGKDSCLGDGGGPLACPMGNDRSRFVLAGIVNWGIKCGVEDIPSVYTNIANMRPWIDQFMNSDARTNPNDIDHTTESRPVSHSTIAKPIFNLPPKKLEPSSTPSPTTPSTNEDKDKVLESVEGNVADDDEDDDDVNRLVN